MHIRIDNHSATPIYDQIYRQMRELVTSGAIAPDEPFPSIRALARDLCISVITTKRAYDELEKEGYLYTVAGKGCYAAKQNKELLRERTLSEIETHVQAICTLAAKCDLTKKELTAMLDIFLEDTL